MKVGGASSAVGSQTQWDNLVVLVDFSNYSPQIPSFWWLEDMLYFFFNQIGPIDIKNLFFKGDLDLTKADTKLKMEKFKERQNN